MSVDFKTYKKENPNAGGDFSPLPTDRYDVEVQAAEVFIANKTGNNCIKTQFVVISEKFKNRKLWTNFTLVSSAMGFLYPLLEVNKCDLLEQDGIDEEVLAKAMVGMRANGYVEPDNSGETASNKISGYKPVKGEYEATTSVAAAPAKKGGDLFG